MAILPFSASLLTLPTSIIPLSNIPTYSEDEWAQQSLSTLSSAIPVPSSLPLAIPPLPQSPILSSSLTRPLSPSTTTIPTLVPSPAQLTTSISVAPPSAIQIPFTPRSALSTLSAPPLAIPVVFNGPIVSKKKSQEANTSLLPKTLEFHPENNLIPVVCAPELGSPSGSKEVLRTWPKKRKYVSSSLTSISTSRSESPVSISEAANFLSKKNSERVQVNDSCNSYTDEGGNDSDSSDNDEGSDHFSLSKIQQTHPELFSRENTSEYEIKDTFDYTQGDFTLLQ